MDILLWMLLIGAITFVILVIPFLIFHRKRKRLLSIDITPNGYSEELGGYGIYMTNTDNIIIKDCYLSNDVLGDTI